jgi:SAM-dependent MidA family methyltransferase
VTPLGKKLAARIAAEGPIPVHDYIAACLYDGEHGYYRVRPAIGASGDFTTAPEISQVFGELLGVWAYAVWQLMKSPSPVRLIELGPGRGTLMADALRATRSLPGFQEAATVHLVETSSALRAAQAQALAGHPNVAWHDDVAVVPDGPAILIANEYLDCLPVRQFEYGEDGQWHERVVRLAQDGFELILSAGVAGINLANCEERGSGLPGDADAGAILELRPGIAPLLDTLAQRAQPFAACLIDYGPARSGFGDTVQAVKQHAFAAMFGNEGEADITAHVDFAGLASNASDRGFHIHGPMPMGQWLLRMGAEARLAALTRNASPAMANTLAAGLKRLIDPSQMGALFKVLVLTHGMNEPPPPFQA